MRNKGSAGEDGGVSDQMDNDIEKQTVEDEQSCVVSESGNSDQSNFTIVICNGGAATEQPVEMLTTIDLESPKKPHLSRNSSSQEQCRVCQQDKEEELIILGCECKGGLSKAHRSCINTWFNIKGTNKCEICQHVASNVAPPAPLPTPTYWIWRVDPDFRGIAVAPERDRRACFSPLWVAFSILIGGLLLDVLISVTLGVSALPVNIIIGVIVVLGLGTALRLALEFCHEWSVRRVVHRTEANTGIGYHPTL